MDGTASISARASRTGKLPMSVTFLAVGSPFAGSVPSATNTPLRSTLRQAAGP